MKEILWLPSWYPSRLDRFTGDFVQRHAQALALYRPVTVLYLVKDEQGMVTRNVLAETQVLAGVTEIIVYYKPRQTGLKWIDKLLSVSKYLSVYKQHLQELFSTGHPACLHVHVPMKAGVLALWCKKKFKLPFLVTEHWCAYNRLNPENFFTKGMVFQWFSKRVFESASRVITVCESNRQELLSLFKLSQSMVVNNVANEQLFFHEKISANPVFTFVHVSTLHPQKNISGLLSALQLFKTMRVGWHCIIVGPYTADIRAHADKLGLQQELTWRGELAYQEVANVVRKADCMLMFSKYENSPCTIIEALSAGIPVISSSVGGIPELINESNGLLVPSGDVNALATAMQQMMDWSTAYDRAAIAAAARARYSYEVIGAQLDGLYK